MILDRLVAGRPCVFRTAFLLITLPSALPAGWLAAADPVAPARTTAESAAAVGESTEASLQAKQQELADRRHRIEEVLEAGKTAPGSAADRDAIRMELEVLKYFELVCSQHRDELARATDLRADQAHWTTQLHELRLAGPAEPKPFSILLLDDLQDQCDAENMRLHTLAAELAAAKDLQQSSRRMLDDADAKRRKTKESLETERNEATLLRLRKQLELEQLTCQLFTEMVQLRRTEIGNKELEHKISELRTQYLQEKLKVIEGGVVFTSEHLQTVIGELEKYENDLRTQLPPLQSKLQEIETRAFDAEKEQPVAAGNTAARAEMQEGWQRAKQNYQTQIKMIHQRLREVVLARLEWNARYKIFNRQATREELAKWEEDAALFLDRIRAGRQLIEDQSKALIVEIGSKEKRLRVVRSSSPDSAKWVEYQIANMHELSQAFAMNLVQVETIERMLAKLAATLHKDSQPESGRDWLSRAQMALAAAWNYELTSVDDRPITVRKVVAGLVLLLIGFYVSRRLSRLIGNRMLPRLGLNSGAATAVQSISFYLLLTCFGFVSLELINIPITVFTFLGGAVAIGVGFGSQNILNNFISGLILLAEQPIRVGDLVDIGGLCGNVEKIGARSTRVKTGSNLEIIVPNSKFLEDNVTNWTLTDTRMRTVVKVGVAYGSPAEDVDRLLRQAVHECPNALTDPEPIILFNDFGDNALSFEVHFWTYVRTMMQARRIESDLRHVIDRLFRETNITIAFPQRDIHLDTLKPLEVNVRQIAESSGTTIRRSRAA